MLSAIALGGGGPVTVPPAAPPPVTAPAAPPAASYPPSNPTQYVTVNVASASAPPDAATLAAAGITLQQFLDAQAAGLGAAAATQVLLAGGTETQATQEGSTVAQQIADYTGADTGGSGDNGNGGGVEYTTLQGYKPSGVVASWRDLIDVFKVTGPKQQAQVKAMFDSPKEFFS